MKFTKNASLNLSINAIVILILAITMLGLGLGFMRNIFGSATEEFEKVGGTVQKQMVEQMKQTNKIVDISRPKLTIKQGNKDQVYLAFRNAQGADSTFTITSVDGVALVGGVSGAAIPGCTATNPEVSLKYKTTETTVKTGETTVIPMNIIVEPNTPKGTCFFDVKVSILSGDSTAEKHIELTIDVTV